MATKTSQRVFIWVITIVLTIGTIGTYAVMVLGSKSQNDEAQQYQQALQQYKDQAYATNLPIKGYQAESFKAGAVKKLEKTDLEVGHGKTVTKDDKVNVDYFGWTPDGKIFDSSNKKTGDTPFDFKPSGKQVIKGWVEGVPGMKVGGVRKLIIPADMAYGSAGSPPLIDANTPLTYIVKLNKIE